MAAACHIDEDDEIEWIAYTDKGRFRYETFTENLCVSVHVYDGPCVGYWDTNHIRAAYHGAHVTDAQRHANAVMSPERVIVFGLSFDNIMHR